MPRRDAELKARLLATFQIEADEHLVALRRHLLALAGGGGPDLVEATFRDMHTLKGAARSVGLRDVERVCAYCETVLSACRARARRPGPAVVALLEDAVAVVGTLVRGEGEGPGRPPRAPPGRRVGPAARAARRAPRRPPTATAARHPPPPARRRVRRRGRQRRRARLVARRPRASPRAPPRRSGWPRTSSTRSCGAGEDLLAIKLVADEWVAERRGARRHAARGARSSDDPAAELRALEGPARELVNGLRRDRRAIAGAVDGLLDQARRVRMMPASTVFDLLPLMARDLAHSQGKRVTFEAAGGELLVDRRVLEAIKDPLMHMVRNAVDHGIELPRRARGRRQAAARAGSPRR